MLTLTFMVPVWGSFILFLTVIGPIWLFVNIHKKIHLSSVLTRNKQLIIGGFNRPNQVLKLTGCGLEKAGFGSTMFVSLGVFN